MTLNALAYLRCSGLGQVDGDSFLRQRDAIQAFASRSGMEVVGEYRDEGVSGTVESEGREGFSAMIDRIASNCVRCVIVERSDRLARDLLVSEMLISRLARLEVRIMDASSGLDLTDSTDPTRVLIRQLMGAVDEFNKSGLVVRLRKARTRIRSAHGRCEGRKPYGVKEGESEILTRMMAMTYQGKSTRQIADALNAENIPSRYGRLWTFGGVARIIKLSKERENRMVNLLGLPHGGS